MHGRRNRLLAIGLIVALISMAGGAYFRSANRRILITQPNNAAQVVGTPLESSTVANDMKAPAFATQPDNSVVGVTYQYNAQGQVQTIIYPGGTTYTYQYNSQGDKIREIDGKTGKVWTYVYDQNHTSPPGA